ncbi:MAG: hypothetical protein LLG06_19050 [Desulfobacteraceae bacterium]|nr:hypothetical protein [Desulfobacteraceae bacterium]
MAAEHDPTDSPARPGRFSSRWFSILCLTIASSVCAMVNMEFEICIVVIGYITTELSTWPTA